MIIIIIMHAELSAVCNCVSSQFEIFKLSIESSSLFVKPNLYLNVDSRLCLQRTLNHHGSTVVTGGSGSFSGAIVRVTGLHDS